jgi:hypothetical protein
MAQRQRQRDQDVEQQRQLELVAVAVPNLRIGSPSAMSRILVSPETSVCRRASAIQIKSARVSAT